MSGTRENRLIGALVSRDSGVLGKILAEDKVRLSDTELPLVWHLARDWVAGLELLREANIPGLKTLTFESTRSAARGGSLELALWGQCHAGWVFGDEDIPALWRNHFVQGHPVPKDPAIYRAFPPGKDEWLQILVKIVLEPFREQEEDENAPVVFVPAVMEAFGALSDDNKDANLALLHAMAEEVLWRAGHLAQFEKNILSFRIESGRMALSSAVPATAKKASPALRL